MNSILESLWIGHEIIIKKNGEYYLEKDVTGTEMQALKKAIIESLSQMEEATSRPPVAREIDEMPR
jgi:hypothetical protein